MAPSNIGRQAASYRLLVQQHRTWYRRTGWTGAVDGHLKPFYNDGANLLCARFFIKMRKRSRLFKQ